MIPRLLAISTTVAVASALFGRELNYESPNYESPVTTSYYPVCPNCTVEVKQAILDTTKSLLLATKQAYQAKGEVWWAKDQFVAAGCESGIVTTTTTTEGHHHSMDRRRLNEVGAYGFGVNYYHHPDYTVSAETCAEKAAALAAAKAKLAAAIDTVLAGITDLGSEASECTSSLGSAYANHYRALWESATTLDPNNLGYLSTCLDKIKYLLETLLGLEKVILAKDAYAIVLETKLGVALTSLAACEAAYPGGANGYGANWETAWGEDKTYAYQYYGVNDAAYSGEWKYHNEGSWLEYGGGGDWTMNTYDHSNVDGASVSGEGYYPKTVAYSFPACKDILASVAWLQGEICYVEKKLLTAIAETVKVGTLLAAKSAKCFPVATSGVYRRM